MSWEETEKAFYECAPVRYVLGQDEYCFPNIHALKYTRNKIYGVELSAELYDSSGHAVIQVDHKRLERIGEAERQ